MRPVARDRWSAGRLFFAARVTSKAPGRASVPTVIHGIPKIYRVIAETRPTPVPVAMKTPLIKRRVLMPPMPVLLTI